MTAKQAQITLHPHAWHMLHGVCAHVLFAFLSLLWSLLSKELCSFGFFRWNFSNRSLAYLQPYLFLPTLSNKRSFFLLFLTIMNFSGALLGQTRQPVLASNKSKAGHKLKHTKPFISDSAVMELLAGLHYGHLLATVGCCCWKLHFFKTMRMPEHNRFNQLLCQHPHLCFSSMLNNWKGHTLLKSFNSTDLFYCCCCNNVTLLCDDTKCKGV